MKRIVMLLLAAALVLSLFTGCAAKTEKPALDAASPSAEAPTESEKITVTDLDGKTYSFDKPLDNVILFVSLLLPP